MSHLDVGNVFCRHPNGSWESLELGLRGNNKFLFEDREGNVWRGSFGGGLTRLRPRIFNSYQLGETDFDRYATALCSDSRGNTWMLLNPQRIGYVEAGGGAEMLQTWGQSQGFRTIYGDRAGTIWLGCNDGRIGRWHDGKFTADLKVSPESDLVNAFFEDAQSNLWVGFTQGKGVGFMPGGDPAKWRTVEGMSYRDIRAITQAPDGAMWFGTHYGGAFRYQGGHWTRFTTRDGLPSDYVRWLHADADGTLWLGTIHGLARWRNGVFVAITSKNGLWHDSLSAMLEDSRGNFWISSFGGVFRVSRKELNEFADGVRPSIQCIGYNHNDGLLALESPGGFQPAAARTSDGRLWFPTVDGVISVAPNDLADNKVPPPVILEEISVEGMAQKKQTADSTERPPTGTTIEIPAGKRRVEFRFTALSFTAPEKVRFRHKLEGLDNDWSAPDDRRSIAYNFVPHGHYIFRVTACNNDGVWNPDGTSLAFDVLPFYWQTWWFRTSVGVLLAAGLAGGVRQRERRKARLRLARVERQHAVERERARIAQDIHDEVGASLTQIAFLSDRVQLAREEPAEVEHWNRRVRESARRTIQSLDEIVWAVSPKHDSLESLANYITTFAQEHLALAGVRCALEIPTVLPPIALSAELRHNLLLAVREALQNAVTHAAATEIKVALDVRDGTLEICIHDNGRGFDVSRVNGDGHGLTNIRKRLQEIGGHFEINSQPGHGTTVKFIVPREQLKATPE
jgi:signal transduction histidine kinase